MVNQNVFQDILSNFDFLTQPPYALGLANFTWYANGACQPWA